MTQKQLTQQAINAIRNKDEATAVDVLAQLEQCKRLSAEAKNTLQQLESFLDDVDVPPETLSSRMKGYRRFYSRSHLTKNGEKSVSNGDDVALALEHLDPDEVCVLADQLLPLPVPHAVKYERLNPGHRRMCAGNRLRSAVNRGDLIVEDRKLKAVTK